jgi:hypothetical protein
MLTAACFAAWNLLCHILLCQQVCRFTVRFRPGNLSSTRQTLSTKVPEHVEGKEDESSPFAGLLGHRTAAGEAAGKL